MAGEISFYKAKVEVSTNGTTWTDISAAATAVEVKGGDRKTGEAYSYSLDYPVITQGKREPINVTVKALYTEGTSEAFETARTAYEAGTSLYVRWSPKGGSTGSFQFVTDPGIVTSLVYPAGEAEKGDPLLCEFTVETAKITKSVAA
jgi:ABC-type glycerol-3-phosphate transport system substrate-binding protein